MTFQPVTNLQTLPKSGIRVRVVSLGPTTGMLIKQIYLDARKAGIEGTYKGWVPGHGGDVWWVVHADQSVAAYMTTELEYWNNEVTAMAEQKTQCKCHTRRPQESIANHKVTFCSLHEAAPLMLKELQRLEWQWITEDEDGKSLLACLSCLAHKKPRLEHFPKCTLDAAIKAARGE